MIIIDSCIKLAGYIFNGIAKICNRMVECCFKGKSEPRAKQTINDTAVIIESSGFEEKALRQRTVSGIKAKEQLEILKVSYKLIMQDKAAVQQMSETVLGLSALLLSESVDIRWEAAVLLYDIIYQKMYEKKRQLDSTTTNDLIEFLNSSSLIDGSFPIEDNRRDIQSKVISLIPDLVFEVKIENHALNTLASCLIKKGKNNDNLFEIKPIAEALAAIFRKKVYFYPAVLTDAGKYFNSIINIENKIAIETGMLVYKISAKQEAEKLANMYTILSS